VLICSVPSATLYSCRAGTSSLAGCLSGFSCLCLLAWRFALSASGSTISQAFLMLHATFMMALLLMMLGRPFICRKSCASVRSMSSLFHKPAATIGVPIYTRMLLASTQVRVSLMAESTFFSFHFRWPRLRLMLARHFSFYVLMSRCTGTPRYLTCVTHGIPAMLSYLSSVSTYDFALFSLRFHAPLRLSNS
jgi:hypothetical protein